MKRIGIIVLLLLVLSGCTEQSDLSYYEIVHERANCDPYCLTEYIVLSNGLVLEKTSNTIGFINNDIQIVKIDSLKAVEAIKTAQSTISESRNERCENCNEYTLLLEKNNKAMMYATKEENTPENIKQIFSDTQELFLSGEEVEKFWLQFVFKRLGQNSVDFHFFPNGSVLKEEFIETNSTLANVELFEIEKSKLDYFKEKIDEGFFDSQNGLENCVEKGLNFGYLEAQKNDLYKFLWTCGAGESKADQIFNELLAEFG